VAPLWFNLAATHSSGRLEGTAVEAVGAVMQLSILGAHGQVGRALNARARRNELPHRAFGRAECDITDADSVKRAVAGSTILVNCAAYTAVDLAETDQQEAFRVNALGPQYAAAACAEAGIPLIHLSTDYVFDGQNPRPAREDDPPRPLNAYGRSKLAGEEKVRERLAQHIILRTSWVFSAYGANFVKTVLRLAGSEPELRIVADQIGGPTAANDIAQAILEIVRACAQPGFAAWGTYHFSGTPAVSWCEFARAIMAKRRTVVVPIATKDFPRPAHRPLNSVLDCSRISRVFGIGQPDWRMALTAVRDEIAAGQNPVRSAV
jgi:dTDP-4-dehydrorhamnose reductase